MNRLTANATWVAVFCISAAVSASGQAASTAVVPEADASGRVETMAQRYPPRVEDLRPTPGWAPQFRRPIEAAVRERVALNVDWADNDVSDATVTFGVPFARGALLDPAGARIVTADGTPVPAEFRTTATWEGPDGPVRWALAHAHLHRDEAYSIEYGTAVNAHHGTAIEIREEAGRVHIDTGPLQVTLSRQTASVIESATLVNGGEVVSATRSAAELPVVVDAVGTAYYAGGADDGLELAVVEAGPRRAAVRRQGWYLDPSGNRFCKFVTYTYFYAGQAGIRHDHTLIVAFNSNAHQVRNVTLPVPLELGPDRQATFATDSSPDGAPMELAAGNGRHTLVQTAHDAWTLSGPDGTLETGTRSGGWFGLSDGSRGAFAGLSDFWQQSPAALETDGNVLRVHLWPPAGAEPLDFRPSAQLGDRYPGDHGFHGRWYRDGLDEMTQAYGVGKTHNLHLEFFAAGEPSEARRRIRARSNTPVLALPDPVWICESDVLFGRVHPHDPEQFPKIEALLDDLVAFYYLQREANEQYGWIHFGDVFNTGSLWRRWASMFYGFPNLMPRLYLRSGNRDAWDFHRVNTRHITDLDICHLDNADFGKWRGGRYGGDGGIAHYAAEQYGVGCDTHVEFMFMDYYLNGNLRVREVADTYLRAYAARREFERPMTSYYTRHTGGALRLFTEAYLATWDPEYLSIMRQVADQLYEAQARLGMTRMDDVYMNPGKLLYYQATGEERMLELFLNDMRALTERRHVHVLADGRAATMSGLAHAYWMTGDAQYLPFLHWQLTLPLERGLGGIGGPRVAVNATHGSQLPEVMALLAAVETLPAPLGPPPPARDANPLALKSNGPFYLLQETDGDFSVTLNVNPYETRASSFPAWRKWLAQLPEAERPVLRVFDPEGHEIRRVDLPSDDDARLLTLDFSADGKTGTYAFVPFSPAAPISVRPAETTLTKCVFYAGENWLSGNISRTLRHRTFYFTVPAGTEEFSLELKSSQLRSRIHYGVVNAAGALARENEWQVGGNPRNDWETVALDAGAPETDEVWSVAFNGTAQTYLRFTGIPGYVASSPNELFLPAPGRRPDVSWIEIPEGDKPIRYVATDLPWGGRAAYPARTWTLDAPANEDGIFDERQGTVEFWIKTADRPDNLSNRSLLGGSIGLSRRLNLGTYVSFGGSLQRFFILPPGRWTHLAITWQPSTEPGADLHVKLFADGIEVAAPGIDDAHRKAEPGWPGRRLSLPAGNFVSNLRVSDTVRYNHHFARPVAPFEPDDQTRVLMPFAGDGTAWLFGNQKEL